jgi:hypothetical protein
MSNNTYDRLLVLGNLIGYGAKPNEVVDRIYELALDGIIRDNPNKVAAKIEKSQDFNLMAAEAAR